MGNTIYYENVREYDHHIEPSLIMRYLLTGKISFTKAKYIEEVLNILL